MRSEHSLSTMPHCLERYKFVLRARSSTLTVRYPVHKMSVGCVAVLRYQRQCCCVHRTCYRCHSTDTAGTPPCVKSSTRCKPSCTAAALTGTATGLASSGSATRQWRHASRWRCRDRAATAPRTPSVSPPCRATSPKHWPSTSVAAVPCWSSIFGNERFRSLSAVHKTEFTRVELYISPSTLSRVWIVKNLLVGWIFWLSESNQNCDVNRMYIVYSWPPPTLGNLNNKRRWRQFFLHVARYRRHVAHFV